MGSFRPSQTTPSSPTVFPLLYHSPQTTQKQMRQTLQILSFTHPLFFSPTGAALELFSAPPPWNIFYYSSKGALSTSLFLLRKSEKTRHLWLFNANSCHLQEQNLWIIKIKHNHKLQKIDTLASRRGGWEGESVPGWTWAYSPQVCGCFWKPFIFSSWKKSHMHKTLKTIWHSGPRKLTLQKKPTCVNI